MSEPVFTRPISNAQATAIALTIKRTEELRHDLNAYRSALAHGTVREIDKARAQVEERIRGIKDRAATFHDFDDGLAHAALDQALDKGFRAYPEMSYATASDEVKDAVDYRETSAAESVDLRIPENVGRTLGSEMQIRFREMGAYAHILTKVDPTAIEAPKALDELEAKLKDVASLIGRYRASAALQRATYATLRDMPVDRKDVDAIERLAPRRSWVEGLFTGIRPMMGYDPASGVGVVYNAQTGERVTSPDGKPTEGQLIGGIDDVDLDEGAFGRMDDDGGC